MDHREHMKTTGWGRLAAMIGVSTVIMFFLMYQLVYTWDDALFSINRLLAALVMGCVMTAVMLAFMWQMYQGQGAKLAVLGAALVGAVVLLFVNRGQSLVGDTTFMRAMIPHHSIAINNARKAGISDPRVRALADGIIQSQVKEIAEMKLLIADIDRKGERGKVNLAAVPAAVTPEMEPEIRRAVQ